MSDDLASAVMPAVQAAQVRSPAATGSLTQIKQAAQAFESVFISQMLGQMFEGISTDGPFGGGQGEAMFRSLMVDEYGKQIAAQGGIGLADNVTRELLQHQEAARRTRNTAARNTAAQNSDGQDAATPATAAATGTVQ
jgi:peptidoglycan hydrolase FlgJ